MMTDTKRELKVIALDIGNGFCKLNHPGKGENISIPAYVDAAESKGIDGLFQDSTDSYRVTIEGSPDQVVGNAARAISFEAGDATNSNGLWEGAKDEYYLHFLASLFIGMPKGVEQITIKDLFVTVQPKPLDSQGLTQCEQNAMDLEGSHSLTVAGRQVVLKVGKVHPYPENRATALLAYEMHKPAQDYAVIQFGKGTTHCQVYSPQGQAVGDTITLRGMAKLMAPLQKRIREEGNNLSPSCEELTQFLASGQQTITVGPKTVKLSKLLKSYKKGFAGQLDKVLAALPVPVSEVYLAGGAVSLADAWDPKGVEVKPDWAGDVSPQFIELQGLLEISKRLGK